MLKVLSPGEKLFFLGCILIGLLLGIGFPDKVTIQNCSLGLAVGLGVSVMALGSLKFLAGEKTFSDIDT